MAQEWKRELLGLTEFAESQPHAALASLLCGLIVKWCYLTWTIPDISHLLDCLETIICSKFLLAIIVLADPGDTGDTCLAYLLDLRSRPYKPSPKSECIVIIILLQWLPTSLILLLESNPNTLLMFIVSSWNSRQNQGRAIFHISLVIWKPWMIPYLMKWKGYLSWLFKMKLQATWQLCV